jgi:hypothetical protein
MVEVNEFEELGYWTSTIVRNSKYQETAFLGPDLPYSGDGRRHLS